MLTESVLEQFSIYYTLPLPFFLLFFSTFKRIIYFTQLLLLCFH